jgi:hypothetical protein
MREYSPSNWEKDEDDPKEVAKCPNWPKDLEDLYGKALAGD